MKNYKKIIAIALSLLIMLSLVACGEKATDECENTYDATVNDVVEDTTPSESESEKATDECENTSDAIVSDVVEDTTPSESESEKEKLPHEIIAEFENEQLGSNSVMLKEKLGRNFGAVSNGSDFGSSFNEDELRGEMTFMDETHGNYVIARMMRVTSTTVAGDVLKSFGLDWEGAVEETVYENVTATVLRTTTDEGDIIGAYWMDEDAGLVYGIIVLGETLELEQYVAEIFYP